MKTFAVYLWPRSSLASELGSDMLFGAVCWAFRVMEQADLSKLPGPEGPSRFAFSSTFPVYKVGDDVVRFYPRPIWLELAPAQVNRLAREDATRPFRQAKLDWLDRAESLKKITYVSELLFGEAVRGEMDAVKLVQRLQMRDDKKADVQRACCGT